MKQNKPLVSIILPTYNGEKYIKKSIESCLNQTYPNIELIIVNDASKDNTAVIVKSFKDSKIKYIKHKYNMGLPNSLNTGFTNAKGNYLTWTSDDNFYDKKAIEKMLNFLKKKKCSFVYCDMYKFDEKNPLIIKRIYAPDQLALEYENNVGACFLYTKEVYESIGKYDPETVLAEDYDYWIRISKKFKMYHLSEVLYYYRVHEESLFSQYEKFGDTLIANILVRCKNNMIDIDKAIVPFIISILTIKMKKDRYYFIRMILRFFIKYKFKKIQYWSPLQLFLTLIYSDQLKQIVKILRDFQERKINYNLAKTMLKNYITQKRLT